MAEPLIRGMVILAYKAYFERKNGDDAFVKIVRRMPPEHAEHLAGIPLAGEWYPTQAVVSMVETAAELFPEPDFHDKLGVWNAEYDLNFVYRFLLKFTSPVWIVSKGGKLWSNYHNTGHWTIETGPGPREFTGTLHDFALVRPNFCKMMVGWLRRAAQLTGAKNIQIHHPRCRVNGAPACVYHGIW